jgi:hypothetical protein
MMKKLVCDAMKDRQSGSNFIFEILESIYFLPAIPTPVPSSVDTTQPVFIDFYELEDSVSAPRCEV